MANIFKITILTLLCFSLCAGNGLAESQVSAEAEKTQVVIIGTLHNFHYESPQYKPEVLRDIVLALKPDAILNELPLSQVDPNGRPLFRHYLKSPEGWAADTVATRLGIKQIPFDRPDRGKNFVKTNYWVRQRESNKLSQKWLEQVQKDDPNSVDLKILHLQQYASQAQAYLHSANIGPDFFNSQAFDSIIRIKHSVWREIAAEILKKYPGYGTLVDDCHFFRDQWNERNKIMADNIVKAAKQYPGKRIVVVTGAEHRYILRDLLKSKECINLREYWEVIDFDLEKCLKAISSIPNAGMIADGLTKGQASQKITREYWQAVINGDWGLVNKLRPPIGDVNWKEKYSKNPPVELIEIRNAYFPQKARSTGPVTPCIVKFSNGKIMKVQLVVDFRKINGRTICFISARWGKPRQLKTADKNKGELQ